MFQAHLPPPFPRASSYCTALVKCKVGGQVLIQSRLCQCFLPSFWVNNQEMQKLCSFLFYIEIKINHQIENFGIKPQSLKIHIEPALLTILKFFIITTILIKIKLISQLTYISISNLEFDGLSIMTASITLFWSANVPQHFVQAIGPNQSEMCIDGIARIGHIKAKA